MYGSAGI